MHFKNVDIKLTNRNLCYHIIVLPKTNLHYLTIDIRYGGIQINETHICYVRFCNTVILMQFILVIKLLLLLNFLIAINSCLYNL